MTAGWISTVTLIFVHRRYVSYMFPVNLQKTANLYVAAQASRSKLATVSVFNFEGLNFRRSKKHNNFEGLNFRGREHGAFRV